jgi:hypothetical protein
MPGLKPLLWKGRREPSLKGLAYLDATLKADSFATLRNDKQRGPKTKGNEKKTGSWEGFRYPSGVFRRRVLPFGEIAARETDEA